MSEGIIENGELKVENGLSEWREYQLEDIAHINPTERIPKGTIAKKVAMKFLQPFTKKIPTFSIEEYKGGVKFKNGDTVMARITPSLENGKTAYVDVLDDDEIGYGSTEFIVLREKEGISDKQFIYYFSVSPELRDIAILSMTGSSGRQRVQTDVVKQHEFSLPPLPEQKAIAEVLSSLDDKIDLLHRQNKTLEQMAETLFRQWFIERKAQPSLNPSQREGDEEDWEEKPLIHFGDVICGKTPSKKKSEYYDGDIPFIKIPDMHGNTFLFSTTDTLTEAGSNSQKNKLLPPKAICVSCIATVGLVSMNTIESQTNQQINSIIPKEENFRYFLYLFVKSSYDLLHAMASGGTATLNLNTGNFQKMDILKPDNAILNKFHNLVEPQFNKIYLNQQQIRTLESLRDTLLPKLMSGEIRVAI